MNKFYSCIALALALVTNSAYAQKSWEVAEQSAETIVPGVENFYVLQEGDNTDAETGNPGQHSKGYFLNVVAPTMSPEVKNSCIFNFIEDGTNSFGAQLYVLRNVEKQTYLGPNGTWVKTTAQAYHFSLSKARAVDENGADNAAEATWDMYHDIVSMSRSAEAVALGAWVLCHPDRKEYIGFIGEGLSFKHWIDTNNWLIKEATGTEMTAQEKFVEVYNKYFAEISVDEETFPIGENPGCVSESFYNRLEATFNDANALLALPSAEDEAYEAMSKQIVNIMEEYQTTGMVQVAEGYFLIRNTRGDLKDNGKNGVADKNLDLDNLESWNINNARYIWQIEKNEEGKLLFKNFGTGHYLGKDNSFAMTEEPKTAFTTPHFKGILFNLHDGNRLVNITHGGGLTNWDAKDDEGNLYQFVKMEQLVIDTLGPVLNNTQMSKKLKDLVNEANRDLMSVKYTNGFMASGDYNHPADTGLVREFMAANATSTQEGGEDKAFDGKLDTYYHTAYGTDAAADGVEGHHWVQFDLGKKVSELIVKFTERKGNYNGSPVQFVLIGAEGDNPDGNWNLKLAKSADSILYTFPSEFKDSATYIQKFTLKEPSQYVRFEVTQTKKSINHSNGSGPLWHVSEFRLYDAEEIKDNPKFLIMDQTAVKNLVEAIATAETELKDKAATEQTYTALEEALEKFWENYPNSSELENALETAEEMLENAVEGEELAQYKTGSITEFRAAIENLKKIIEEKTLTLAEIEQYQNKLDAAIEKFNNSLNVPAANKIYRLVCAAPLETEGNPHAQWNSCVATANADINDNPVWRYNVETDDIPVSSRINAFWEVKQDEKGFTFRNIATGFYLNNPYEGLSEEEQEEIKGGLIHYSAEPKHFTLEAAHLAEKAFLIRFKKGEYLNTDPIGKVVHYSDRNDVHAFFTFEEVTDDEFSGSYAIDAEANKVQIMSLPVQLDALYTQGTDNTEGLALKVLGKMDGKIQLTYYADGEEIPAGTPFIVVTTADETFLDAVIDGNVESLKALSYNYNEENQNGLISSPMAFDAKEPYGILVNGKVIPAEIGTRISAGTGYFNTSLPEIEEEGDFAIVIEGDITGEGTGVDHIDLVKNVANDVYTISGVKIRHNVKGSAATKGLPKGIYIVGGKKVIVK